ncbi:hypothetical protein A3K86_03775 [Photobacterium jeanii]|uniref:Uncharacterized protein n=1 Tax=Photobacterium jeanii TaxID=858640 RepID=A0A178KLA3_9GAMM|nr:hypothetical protein [Photobacterium jeanii]OAN18047.1 hypothetical protein A3K86_03775 [Photobacterium jeanii]PST92281.1 hypothetical protein C9I91_03665 [Photobacterium jeanii]
MTSQHHAIDIPFEYRHTCWFCGEPYYDSFGFMPNPNYEHQSEPLLIPSCQECFNCCKGIKVSSLDLLRDKVKEQLHKRYAKHLQIGINWTKEELEDCEFEGKALEGFRESAWMMFEIAKARVNYQGWPVSIDGMPVAGISNAFQFEFDGIRYTGLQHAVKQLALSHGIPQPYLEQVIELVGREKMAYALRFCKTSYGYSEGQIKASIESLKALLAEEAANASVADQSISSDAKREIPLSEIKELILFRTMVSPHAIQWALERGIDTLEKLAQQEEGFFAHFEQDSEMVAFTYFNGLQIYLEHRENDPQWAEYEDPNRDLFASK